MAVLLHEQLPHILHKGLLVGLERYALALLATFHQVESIERVRPGIASPTDRGTGPEGKRGISRGKGREPYHAGIASILQHADIPQAQLRETLVHEIHR
jgi:hypothetical protein